MRATAEICSDSIVRLSKDQAPLIIQDQFHGEINQSSIAQESDLAPFKPACDVLVNGTAYAPSGKAASRFEAGFSVRSGEKTLIEKRLSITGPRYWEKRMPPFGWKLTEPASIASLPIRYEHTYGGVNTITNFVGCGMRINKESRLAAPQIESLKDPIQDFKGTYAPVGFGVVGRNWQPRLKLAGTYDAEWKKARHPYLPNDFDFAYWNGAPTDQQTPYLQGNEHIELTNLTPEGKLAFDLPGNMVYALVRYQTGEMVPTPMNLDTLLIEPDERRVSFVWRLRIATEPEIRVLEARLVMNDKTEVQDNLRTVMEAFHG